METFGLEWTRPVGLAALALPALVWWLARRPRRAAPEATGTLAIWREVADERAPAAGRARRALPPATLLLLAALALGALALGGPRGALPPLVARRVVAVDASPSMFLPWRDADGRAQGTRIERALAAAYEQLDGAAGATEWVRFDGAAREVHAGARPPAEWLVAPRAPRSEPPWEQLDLAGLLWVTDREPDVARARAALCASGGAAVPGPVARTRDAVLEWRAGALVEHPADGPAPRVALVAGAAPLPRALEELLVVWADERGLALARVDGAPGDAVLAVHAAAAPAEGTRLVGAGAWSLRARAPAAGAPVADEGGALRCALSAGDGACAVAVGPGRVHVALAEPSALGGDAGELALWWARLLDAATLPAPGCVALAERADAGPAVTATGRPAPLLRDPGAAPAPVAAWLACAAAACAALALLLAGRAGGRGAAFAPVRSRI